MIEKNVNAIKNRLNAMIQRAESKVFIRNGERVIFSNYFNRAVNSKLKNLGYSKEEYLQLLNAIEVKYEGGVRHDR